MNIICVKHWVHCAFGKLNNLVKYSFFDPAQNKQEYVGRKSFLTIKQNARSLTDSDSSVGALSETRSIRVSLSFDLIKMMIVATLLIDEKPFGTWIL